MRNIRNIFKCLLNYFNLGVKSGIVVHPSYQEVILDGDNESLLIMCKAVGVSSYNWERQDGSIPIGATGVNTNALTFVNPTPECTGNYRCLVGSHSGKRFSDYAKIIVNGQQVMFILI